MNYEKERKAHEKPKQASKLRGPAVTKQPLKPQVWAWNEKTNYGAG